MRYLLLFLVVAILVFAFRNLMTKRDRRRALRSATAWIIPAVVGLTAIIALLYFNLNFNGKVI